MISSKVPTKTNLPLKKFFIPKVKLDSFYTRKKWLKNKKINILRPTDSSLHSETKIKIQVRERTLIIHLATTDSHLIFVIVAKNNIAIQILKVVSINDAQIYVSIFFSKFQIEVRVLLAGSTSSWLIWNIITHNLIPFVVHLENVIKYTLRN